ncbi:PREDICTED: DNA mismatch repair protein MSH7 isoform X1 [Nicotiana attenuata]|uniref:Dna mismatch repair protein msh7 n=1 Tax=Nicotiana attenuata TaxID=49451 RepID=A0A1J6I7H2_NICAT|nr:PREDICTED: DNA mismatch repair protein MSH7 isoform X1 [Nicotiana attenuata]OIT00388.1 dna mismatch repair protein msh7 [Nicotiana attenuata]
MQRQKSILSFLKRPSSEDQSSGNNKHKFPNQNAVPVTKSIPDILGTETPPEKLPRQVLPFNSGHDGNKSSAFSSIRHKFIREKPRIHRDLAKTDSFGIPSLCTENEGSETLGNPSVSLQSGSNRSSVSSNGNSNQEGKGSVSLIQGDDHGFGPETPSMQPFVPGLKRVQDDMRTSGDRSGCSSLDASKRIKSLEGLNIGRKNLEAEFEMTSKFEWLHPSQIKDANGRMPGDPLYDKRTLFIPPDALRKMSASQKQYWDVKCKYMDILLFFKVGKFYELYELDAEIGHKELDWKMTQSGVGKCRQVGISESGIDEAVQKLLARGYKVGRMEQLETSEQAKSRGSTSVIRRKLVHVLTPSTGSEGNIGPDAVHLLAVKETCNELENGSTTFGFAFVDCAALKVWVGSISDDASCAALGALLMQVSPKEVIYDARGLSKDSQKALKKYSLTGPAAPLLSPVQPGADFVDPAEVKNFLDLKGYFKRYCNKWDHTFDGVMSHDVALCALGSLVNHLERLMLDEVLRNGDILSFEVYRGCLKMDGQTLVNLEIFNNNADGSPSGTLYKYLDNCVTSPGKRLLRNWVCHPLKDVEKINHRLDVIDRLVENSEATLSAAQYLRKLPDLDRLLGRVKASIQSSEALLLPLIGAKMLKQRVKVFGLLVKGLRIGLDLLRLLQKERLTSSLAKVVSLPVLDGDDGLDKFLSQFEVAIKSDFPNFQDHNSTDFDAETLSILMELFVEKATEWSQVIYAISCVDVLRSFSITAKFSSGVMCRPVILPLSKPTNFCRETGGPILNIKGLWHPYALAESGGLPVPNDLHLGGNTNICHPRTLLLTGPNMGGKSTLLRATCLAVIMAQLGCYVPGETCVLSLVDIIFTRLGATDRIMTGESTFFIECAETASVLQNATCNSLVLLDELGRGTSTFDGYAIAYAVFRHLIETVNCRLLFATHYHPLTKEFASHPNVTLQHMACSFKLKSQSSSPTEQELVFLYRLASGACPESYGMQVALMAGIPKIVVESASNAGQVMKKMIGESFRSCEQRACFSTLHEEWFKTLLGISKTDGEVNDDLFDTLYCLWHELKLIDPLAEDVSL